MAEVFLPSNGAKLIVTERVYEARHVDSRTGHEKINILAFRVDEDHPELNDVVTLCGTTLVEHDPEYATAVLFPDGSVETLCHHFRDLNGFLRSVKVSSTEHAAKLANCKKLEGLA